MYYQVTKEENANTRFTISDAFFGKGRGMINVTKTPNSTGLKMHTYQDALKSMTSQLLTATTGLFDITFDSEFYVGRSLYWRMYAKPSKRLAWTLSVDREVLILVSNFSDQQARTIQAAKDIIAGSDGRLEPGVVVILHRDSRGNQKLKNWGRDDGITVLPIYLGSDSLPRGEAFERLLCDELFTHDPFDITGPVDDDSRFFGRRTEAQDLARQLQTGQIKSCFGIRKIGKTSITNRIIRESHRHHDCVCVVLDCSRLEIVPLNAAQLISTLANTINKALDAKSSYEIAEAYTGDCAIEKSYQTLLQAIQKCTTPLILFIDEIDAISPSSPFGPIAKHWKTEFIPFWRTLRAVYQETTRSHSRFSMFISGVSSKWFSVESIDGIENSALAMVPEEYLSPLPRGAAIKMIQKIARTAGLQFDDGAAEMVASYCSDMPFWIRKACSFIHKHLSVESRPLSLSKSDISSLVTDFVENDGAAIAQFSLAHLFRVYPELEPVCVGCAEGLSAKQISRLLRVLENYGLVTKTNGRLTGEIIRSGLKLHLESKESKIETIEESSAQENQEGEKDYYGEWAEDLAALSKSRNIIERRLREIAYGFLAYDCLQAKAPLHDRILSAVSDPRKAQLKAIPAANLLSKFNWEELANLLKREWKLFERLFKDKRQLENNSEIINFRPDCHAKDVDLADIALYRRALAWFETCLGNM